MSFTLLGTGELLLLLGAASLITVALYLLKPRKRRVVVPFLPLWESVLSPRPSAALFSRLRHVASLLLALCVVLLLGLARGGPRLHAHAGKHTVLLVDTGRHMLARDVAPTRFAAAVAHARAEIDSREAGDELLVAGLDETVTPLSTMTGDSSALRAALAALRPSANETDLADGMHFALDVLRDRAAPEIILISDGVLAEDPELIAEAASRRIALRQVRVGKRSSNLRVSAVSARRYPLDPSQSEIMVEVQNGSALAAHAVLTLAGDGHVLEVEPLELRAAETQTRFFTHVGGSAAEITATIARADGKPDDLPEDDQATATLPERRRIRVLAVTEGNRYLEAALLLDEMLDVDRVSPAQYRSADGYDVVLFDTVVPAAPPRTPSFYLAPRPEQGDFPFAVTGEVERPYFDVLARNSQLLRFVALRDVNIARALVLRLRPGDEAIASFGTMPLLVRATRDEVPLLALAFDVRNSDLPLRVAWPLLLLRGIEQLTTGPADPAARAVARAAVVGGASLAPRAVLKSAPAAAKRTLARLPSEDLWFWLVLFAAVLVIVEWCSYQRRWTV